MVVSATLSTSPTLIYFGQEVGEPGGEDSGFGKPSRTSIFDYVGVPHHQRWMNEGAFDGGALSPSQLNLRDFYKRLLNFTLGSEALMGAYQDIHHYNKEHTPGYDHRVYSFVRWKGSDRLVIASNFDAERSYVLDLKLPEEVVGQWGLADGSYPMEEMLYGVKNYTLKIAGGRGTIGLELAPLESVVLHLRP